MPAVRDLRSSYEKVGGLYHFGRMVDKIRLQLAGKLPADYRKMYGDQGDATAFDGRCCRFLGIMHTALAGQVEQGLNDAALFAWAWENGIRPEAWEIEAWNAFLSKRGWRDAVSGPLRDDAVKQGFDPARAATFFDLNELDEERPLRFAPEPPLARGPFPGFHPTLLPLRSPYETVGGLVHFGRMLDKIRLHAQGKLPSDWVAAQGAGPGGYDALTCRFLRVDYDALAVEARRGAPDEAVLEWVLARGRKPSEEKLLVWNAFLSKRNWRDEQTSRLHYRLQREGLPATAVRTMFDFLDLDEGRPPRFQNDAESA